VRLTRYPARHASARGHGPDGNGVNEGGRAKCSDHAGAGNELSNHCTCGRVAPLSHALVRARGAHTPVPLRNQVGSLCEMPRMRASGCGGKDRVPHFTPIKLKGDAAVGPVL
jgi:hypothetical protein